MNLIQDLPRAHRYFTGLQSSIVGRLEALDGMAFGRDEWQRIEGGSGTSCILEEGRVFERGGVNFSHVKGERLPPSASVARPQLAGRSFEVMGVSSVLHPRNPHVPTVHMNLRLFAALPREPESQPVWWFGGGMDLTPYYGFEEDATHFHRTCRASLAPFGDDYHPRFKAWCDDYFFLKHRSEPRGIGGIFFDDLNERGFEHCFALTRSVGDHFLAAYEPILQRLRDPATGGQDPELGPAFANLTATLKTAVVVAARGRKHPELQCGALFEEACRHRRGAHIRGDRRDAVATHHDGEPLADRQRKLVREKSRGPSGQLEGTASDY